MPDTVYLLDANVLIGASRRYYAFDLAPRFWEMLVDYAAKGTIASIDRVHDEIVRGKDALADWAEKKFADAFLSTDDDAVLSSYADVMRWVQGEAQFQDAAKAEFARGADGWLVAYAITKGCTVVTHEVLAPDVRNKVPIPNVCQALGVRFA